jgi:methionyl-tRNA formyltransferase
MRLVIIGNSKIANDCLQMIIQDNEHEVVGVLYEPQKNPSPAVLIDSIVQFQIPFQEVQGSVNDAFHLEFLLESKADWIFNINCYQYLKSSLLSIPKLGVINFHNGPLPKYGGVNISSWPIINGEKVHGVTWHIVNAGIDTGDILSQSNFEIPTNATAAQLMIKCIQEGIDLFKENWKAWVTGEILPQQQVGTRTYYSKKDLAPNNGLLDWMMGAEELNRLILGLHLFPYPNDFAYAHFILLGETYWVIAAEIGDSEMDITPGSIIERNSKYCHVKCGMGSLKLKMIAVEFGKPIKWNSFYELLDAASVNTLG